MTQLNMIDALYVITFNRIGNKVIRSIYGDERRSIAVTEIEVEEKMGNSSFLLSLT